MKQHGSDPDDITMCKDCHCMTKTIDSKCGKCGSTKDGEE